MRKIAEIDLREDKTSSAYRWRPSREWILENLFTEPQRRWLVNREWRWRKHPKKDHLVEIYVNHHSYKDLDNTWESLLF